MIVITASLTLAACGGADDDGRNLVDRAKDGQLRIGIKFDQPGLALKKPDGSHAGFEVDVAKYIAKQLGVNESGITWKEAQSAQREELIKKGEVDFVVATYSITDKRKKEVSFAGPYFVAHQNLLIRANDNDITGPESLNAHRKLCSTKGSTSAQYVKATYANDVQLQEFDKFTDCVTALLSGTVQAMTSDDVILAGYATQYKGKLRLAGKGFTDERYGVGLRKDDKVGLEAINKALHQMQQDGSWRGSLETHVGPSGYSIPEPPAIAP
ncbi:glutamate ABC transporter substrate-binding protein [Nonomuraea sp. KM88]|uniref:glutamate ABC transporter substrate-binding protein n=1 Tax=Nonomuraea sp. KM88 TaxID=3457427 RepID=UPI003FCC69FE